MTLLADIPVIDTPRLRLRGPDLRDLDASARFWASDRSHMMGGPWTYDETRVEFEDLLTQWQKHGFSLFTVTRQGSDEAIGAIGPFFPDTHPEPELGWSLWNLEDEGQGVAYEAAIATRDWFFAATPFRTAVSYTSPTNARSHRLCERMGAVVDQGAKHPYGDKPNLTYRHFAGGQS